MLENLGFKIKLIKSYEKGYRNKDGYIRNGTYWILSISKKRDLQSFTKLVLPYLKHKDRILCANKVLKNIEERNLKYGFIGM